MRGYIPLEECVVFLDVSIDRRGDTSFLLVKIPTQYDLRGGFGHHVSETLEVTIGNDARVVRRKDAIMAELHSCLPDRFYKSVLSRAWDKDVIWSYANLGKGRCFSREYFGAPVGW